MSTATPTRARRAASLAEKTILGAIAGAAASIAVVTVVLLVQRIVDLVTPGPTTLRDVVLDAPLTVDSASPFVASSEAGTADLVVTELPGSAIAALVAAAIVGSLLTAVAHAEAAQALGIDEFAPFGFELQLGPLGWAFALLVVAAAFELGQRLQRDTDGLV